MDDLRATASRPLGLRGFSSLRLWQRSRLLARFGRRALFMQVEFTAGTNTKVDGTRLTLSIDNKPAWAC